MAHMLVHTYRLTVQCRYCPKILRSMRERHAHERKHTNRSTKLKEALESANATQPPDDAEAMQDTEAKEAKESEEVSQATESTVSESQVDQVNCS